MSSYEKPAPKKRGRPKKVKDPAPTALPELNIPAPSPEPVPKKARRPTGPMSDKQRSDLNKHMEKMKKGGMSASEMKSHRMKVMTRMRNGMTVNAAHKDVMGE